jgi:hypothetical protein
MTADRFLANKSNRLLLRKATGGRADLLGPRPVGAGMQRCHRRVDGDDAGVRDQRLLGKTPMTLKGGAFLATVPSPDRRVAIPRTVSDGGSQLDAEQMNEATLNAADAAGTLRPIANRPNKRCRYAVNRS